MKDSEVLEKAPALMRKYFHPSRFGRVPDLSEDLNQAETLLAWAAKLARDEEGND